MVVSRPDPEAAFLPLICVQEIQGKRLAKGELLGVERLSDLSYVSSGDPVCALNRTSQSILKMQGNVQDVTSNQEKTFPKHVQQGLSCVEEALEESSLKGRKQHVAECEWLSLGGGAPHCFPGSRAGRF